MRLVLKLILLLVLVSKSFGEFLGYEYVASLIEANDTHTLLSIRDSNFSEFSNKEKFSIVVALRKLEPHKHESDFVEFITNETLEGHFSPELYLPFFPSNQLGVIAKKGNTGAIRKLLQVAEWAGGGLGEGIWYDSMETIVRNPNASFSILETKIEARGRIWGSLVDWPTVWSDSEWQSILVFLETNKGIFPSCHAEVHAIYDSLSNKALKHSALNSPLRGGL